MIPGKKQVQPLRPQQQKVPIIAATVNAETDGCDVYHATVHVTASVVSISNRLCICSDVINALPMLAPLAKS